MAHLPSLPKNAHLSSLYLRYPENVEALMVYTDTILRLEGELSIGERELIATYISGLNGCKFCFASHNAYAIAFGIPDGLARELVDNGIENSPVSKKLKPILRYVKKLNHLPGKIVSADSQAVFAAGWSEKALFEAIQVCALFNLMNRIVEGAGVDFDYDENPHIHPMSSGGQKNQTHCYTDYGRRIAAMAKDMQD